MSINAAASPPDQSSVPPDRHLAAVPSASPATRPSGPQVGEVGWLPVDAPDGMEVLKPVARRIIAVVNMKGGSTKSTTTVNLAAALVARGRTVRMADADPQEGSITHWLPPLDDVGQGLYEVFAETRDLDAATARTSVPGLFIVPSWESLRQVERDREPGSELMLRAAYAASDAAVDYDLIDCPHSKDILAVAGMAAAEEIVIPVQASELDVVGMGTLLELYGRIKKRYSPQLRITAVVVGRVKGRSGFDAQILAGFRQAYPDAIVAPVADSVKMREATAAHTPITSFEPRGIASRDFHALAEAFEGAV